MVVQDETFTEQGFLTWELGGGGGIHHYGPGGFDFKIERRGVALQVEAGKDLLAQGGKGVRGAYPSRRSHRKAYGYGTANRIGIRIGVAHKDRGRDSEERFQ
jgi:hypothetical protein